MRLSFVPSFHSASGTFPRFEAEEGESHLKCTSSNLVHTGLIYGMAMMQRDRPVKMFILFAPNGWVLLQLHLCC